MVDVEHVTGLEGLYNPITTSGTIVVDGVGVSQYARWFLDPYTPAWLQQYLHSAYWVVLRPVFWMCEAWGYDWALYFTETYDVNKFVDGGLVGYTHGLLTGFTSAYDFHIKKGEQIKPAAPTVMLAAGVDSTHSYL